MLGNDELLNLFTIFQQWKSSTLQICGLCLLSVGVWALNEKNSFSNLTSNLLYDPSFFFLISGSVTFLIGKLVQSKSFLQVVNVSCFSGFTGCVGSLRENTFLLSLVSFWPWIAVHHSIMFKCLLVLDAPDITVAVRDWIRRFNLHTQRQGLDQEPGEQRLAQLHPALQRRPGSAEPHRLHSDELGVLWHWHAIRWDCWHGIDVDVL